MAVVVFTVVTSCLIYIYQTAQSAIVPTAGDLQASVAAVEARVGLLENPGDAIV